MPETKLIPTITTLLVDGSSISITSEYLDTSLLPDTLLAAIAETLGIQDSTLFEEGDLIIKVKEYLNHIFYQLDSDGNLILTVNTGDASNYSVDSDGNLIYTTVE